VKTTIEQNSTGNTLTVTATVTQGATLSYQWYSNTSASSTGGTAIAGAVNPNYVIPTSTVGTYYYYCIVSAPGAASVTSNVAEVIVYLEGSFLVRNATELGYVGRGNQNPSGYTDWTMDADYVLMASFTITSDMYVPIGNATTPFTGTFDGNNEIITLNTNQPSSPIFFGLFGNIGNGGTIKNLGVAGSIIGGNFVGGIAGFNEHGTIENSFVTADVTGGNHVSGIVGSNAGGTIEDCYTTGDIIGNAFYIGGIAGNNYGMINDCRTSGSAIGSTEVGGIVGINTNQTGVNGTVQNCVAGNPRVTATNASALIGRIAGNNNSTLNNNRANAAMVLTVNGVPITTLVPTPTANNIHGEDSGGDYGINIIDLAGDSLTIPAQTVGYAEAQHIVRVVSIGTQDTGALSVTLSGTNATSFLVSGGTSTTLTSVWPGSETSFYPSAATSLAPGTYTATVTISNTANGISESFNVSFIVNP